MEKMVTANKKARMEAGYGNLMESAWKIRFLSGIFGLRHPGFEKGGQNLPVDF